MNNISGEWQVLCMQVSPGINKQLINPHCSPRSKSSKIRFYCSLILTSTDKFTWHLLSPTMSQNEFSPLLWSHKIRPCSLRTFFVIRSSLNCDAFSHDSVRRRFLCTVDRWTCCWKWTTYTADRLETEISGNTLLETLWDVNCRWKIPWRARQHFLQLEMTHSVYIYLS